jgi:hypothetical protein
MAWGLMVAIYGSQSTPSAWMIDDISLPIGPEGIQVTGGCEKETMSQTQDDPVQVVDGKKIRTISLKGTIADESKTDGQLWADVISPLLDLEGKEVTLVCPIIGLIGNYLLDSFEPNRDSYHPLYKYTLKLSKGSLNVIVEKDD